MSPVNDSQAKVHNVTVQKIAPSYGSPRKKLSHSVKDVPSSGSGGTFAPIPRRVKFLARGWRR